jgi:DNA-binding SARP family transcriptional activator
MEFRILGPLEVRENGTPIALGGPRQRALLGVLLLSAGRVVSRDRLLEMLAGEDGARAAGHALNNQVSRLRKALGERLETVAPGYRLRVAPGELDRDRFRALLEEGRAALRGGADVLAVELLREAEGLWRGGALCGLTPWRSGWTPSCGLAATQPWCPSWSRWFANTRCASECASC